jgi:DNA polymerase-3 subunit epsilon
MRQWRLCPRLCFVQRGEGPCEGIKEQFCEGACEHKEPPQEYNKRVEEAIDSLARSLPSFTVFDDGRHPEERSCILVEQGRFYGMGYVPTDSSIPDTSALKGYLTRYPENDYIRGLVYQHVERWPSKKIQITG